MKQCTKCKQPNKIKDNWCSKCHAEYRAKNKDKSTKYGVEYRAKNKDRLAKQKAEYHAKKSANKAFIKPVCDTWNEFTDYDKLRWARLMEVCGVRPRKPKCSALKEVEEIDKEIK